MSDHRLSDSEWSNALDAAFSAHRREFSKMMEGEDPEDGNPAITAILAGRKHGDESALLHELVKGREKAIAIIADAKRQGQTDLIAQGEAAIKLTDEEIRKIIEGRSARSS